MSSRYLYLARIVGIFEMIGGIAAIGVHSWNAYQTQVFTYQFPALLIMAAVSFMAGLFLYNAETRGVVLSLIMLALQLVSIQAGGISYGVHLLPAMLDIRILDVGEGVDVAWRFTFFNTGLSIVFLQVRQGWRITLHLVTVVTALLVYLIWRSGTPSSSKFIDQVVPLDQSEA